MSSSNCCFLTCIQISQEAGNVVWYSHLFKYFPQFVVIHTVKGFSEVNEAEVDVFLEFPCFLYDPMDLGNLISGTSAFSKSNLYIWKFLVHVLPLFDLIPSINLYTCLHTSLYEYHILQFKNVNKASKPLTNIEWTVWYIHAILEAEKDFWKVLFKLKLFLYFTVKGKRKGFLWWLWTEKYCIYSGTVLDTKIL